jgi:hypothetical protein
VYFLHIQSGHLQYLQCLLNPWICSNCWWISILIIVYVMDLHSHYCVFQSIGTFHSSYPSVIYL